MPWLISRAVRLAAVSALVCATYFSLRMAWADHLFHNGTRDGARRAFTLEPDNASYALRAGLPERAAALQPRLAKAWIELGLGAERRRRFEQAAGYLERAAAVDATYAPVWTLANFRARRGDNAQFLAASRRALQTGDPDHFDPASLFQLAWSVSQDQAAFLAQGIPPLERIEARYLQFLLATNRMDAASAVAERLLAHAQLRDWLPLVSYCDRLLADGDSEQAVLVWNAFIGRTAPGRARLDPAAGVSLTNGDFAWDSSEHGFDWRLLPAPRVSRIRMGPQGGIRIVFDGRQAERCQILEQLIPVAAGARYRLQFRYRTEAIAAGAGPRWRILDAVTHKEIPIDAVPLASPVDADVVVRFSTPSGVRLALLALVYERVPGTARIAGVLQLERVALSFDQ